MSRFNDIQDSEKLTPDSWQDIDSDVNFSEYDSDLIVYSADETGDSDLLCESELPASDTDYSELTSDEQNEHIAADQYSAFDVSLEKLFNSQSALETDDQFSQVSLPSQTVSSKRKSVKHYKKGHPVRDAVLNGILVFCAVLGIFYLVAVYSNNTFITKYRNMYIQTAMASINHKYLATAIIPSDIIDELLRAQYEAEINAIGVQSDWGNVDVQALPSFVAAAETDQAADETAPETTTETSAAQQTVEIEDGTDTGTGHNYSSDEEKTFFELFYEIDYDSFQDYLSDHPDILDNGWANININEAGLDDDGTSIQTVHGDEVLAINAQEGITLIRIYINSSRGIMAICKDTSKLSLCPASTLGSTGQTIGTICEENNGILALTGSAFMDDGNSNGGQISGLAVCSGTQYGARLGGTDKRIELRTDNKMYIVDSVSGVNENTRDACEFRPALIVDGQIIVDDSCGWTSPNPRAVLGQSEYLETMMVVLEGRLSDSPGDSVVYIAEKLLQYGCAQALNLDGGTSALMYYDGEYVSRCSNTALPGGRTLPTAWVYKR